MGWRKVTRAIIRAYPGLKRRDRELKEMALTANYGEQERMASGEVVNVIMPGGGNASRTTEDVALRQLSPGDQRALDAVERAIRITRDRRADGELRIRLIELVYWKNTHILRGAADDLHISYATASRWNVEFVDLVDSYMRVL